MIVGLTGGIGCGKSVVLAEFASLGWTVFDADAICRRLYESRDPGITEAMRSHWGDRVFSSNGEIDRRKVAARVFSDRNELKWLNDLFHPLVRQEMKSVTVPATGKILCDVPLLYEVEWERDFDAVIAVWTSKTLQRQRLRQRGWSETEICDRLRCQLESGIKLEKADFGIINLFDLNLLRQQCMELDQIIRKYYG